VVWKDQEESRSGVTSRDTVPHSVYMVYAWMMEIKGRVKDITLEHMNMAC